MAPPKSDFERELHVLETELRRLEAEYNQFFAGRLPRLPWDQRARVDAMMKRFDRMHIQNTGDRFRFQTIQSRWAAFTELWERQLKAQEMGRRPGRPAFAGGGAPPPVAPPPRPDPSPREAAPAPPRRPSGTTLSDPAAQEDRVRALYDQVTRARKEAGEKPVPYERFTELVRAQVRKHGAGGREVAFQVDVKGGKVTLSARASEER